MVIHRDYTSSYDSVLKIFDNYIEFYNPGALPADIDLEHLLNNDYVSQPRNKLIAEMFKASGLIEKYGSGIKRVLKAFEDYGLPQPEFRFMESGFRVNVFSLARSEANHKGTYHVTDVPDNVPDVPDNFTDVPDNVTDVPDNVPDVPDNVTDVPDNVPDERLKLVMDLISRNNKILLQEISEQLTVSKRTVRRDIEKLKTQNKLIRVGGEKTGYWEIIIGETLHTFVNNRKP